MKDITLTHKMRNLFSSFDVIGPSPTLNYNGKQNFQTFLGTLFILLALILSIFTISSIIDQAFNKTNPAVSVSSSFDDSEMIMNNSNFQLYITLYNFSLNTFTFTPFDKKDILIPPAFTPVIQNRSGYFVVTDELNLVDCDDSVFNDFNDGFISEKSFLNKTEIDGIKSHAYCFPSQNYSLINSIDKQTFLLITFKNGAVKTMFDDSSTLAIKISWRSVLLRPNTFKTHFQRIWKEFFFTVNLNAQTYYRFYLENYSITKDQTAFLFTDELIDNVISGNDIFTEVSVNQQIKPGFVYTGLAVAKSNMSQQAYIKYTSFNDVLSTFGGSFGVLLSVLKVILEFVVNPFFHTNVINSIFSFYSTTDDTYRDVFKQTLVGGNFGNRQEEMSFVKSRKEEIGKDDGGDKLDNVKDSKEMGVNNYVNKSFGKSIEIEINRNTSKLSDKMDMKSEKENLKHTFDKTKEEFLANALDRIKKNKAIKIETYYFKKYICCIKKTKKSMMLNKLIELCDHFIEKSLNVVTIIRRGIVFQKLLGILFNSNELALLQRNSFNINNCGCLQVKNSKEVSNEALLKLIMEYDFKDRRNRRILKSFITNNY
jgi:hypothetical protein